MHASWNYSEKDLEAATDPECISAGALEHIKIGPCNATFWQNILRCIKVSVQFKVFVVIQKVLTGRGSDYLWVLQCPVVSVYPTKYHRNWNCRTESLAGFVTKAEEDLAIWQHILYLSFRTFNVVSKWTKKDLFSFSIYCTHSFHFFLSFIRI